MAKHADLASIHKGAYVDEADPGAVGADKLWVDTAVGPPYVLKVRNAADTAWEIATGGSGTGPMQFEGAWSSLTAYFVNDVVERNGSGYVAIQNGTNHAPESSPLYWTLLVAKGDTGTGGAKGLQWRGAWSGATAYVADDAVESGGSAYICILAHTNHAPPNATYWQLLASKGADGVIGADGADGTDFAFVASTLQNQALAAQGASFSSSSSGGGATANAFDENDTTYWGTDIATGGADPAAGAILHVDLGSAKAIGYFRVLQGPTYQATAFKLQSSTDDASWTDRRVFASLPDSGVEAIVGGPITARYWRLLGVSGVVNFYWLISTFALYTGDPGTGGIDHSVITMNFMIDGGGVAILSGIKGDMVCDFNGTIEVATLLADVSGSIVVDIWKDSYANYPPVVGDSICASAKPSLSSALKSRDTTLTGWTTAIAAGDVLRFNVSSATTVTRVTVALKIRRT